VIVIQVTDHHYAEHYCNFYGWDASAPWNVPSPIGKGVWRRPNSTKGHQSYNFGNYIMAKVPLQKLYNEAEPRTYQKWIEEVLVVCSDHIPEEHRTKEILDGFLPYYNLGLSPEELKHLLD